MGSMLSGLDARGKQVLAILIRSSSPVTCSSLANELEVSERTVRKVLSGLKDWATQRSMELVVKPRVGVKLEENGNRQRIIKELPSSCGSDEGKPRDRVPQVLWHLLQSDASLSCQELASVFLVSVNTLRKDLTTARQWLTHRSIRLVSPSPGHLAVSCSEWSKRLALCELAQVTWDSEYLSVRDIVESVVLDLQHRDDFILKGSAYYSVICYLVIAVIRYRKGHRVEPKGLSWAAQMMESASLIRALRKLSARLRLSFTQNEVAAACAYVMSVTMGTRLDGGEYESGEPKDVGGGVVGMKAAGTSGIPLDGRGAAEIITILVGNAMGMDLLNDEGLLNDLGTHLDLALSRMASGASAYNPFKSDLRRMYPNLYANTEMACTRVERLTGTSFSDDEVAYAVMYIGAVLERYSRASFSCLVVCASGMGVARFLSERLMSVFPAIHVKGLVPVSRLKATLDETAVDLVISPVGIPLASGVKHKVLAIDPMLPVEARALIADELARKGVSGLGGGPGASPRSPMGKDPCGARIAASSRALSEARRICELVSKKLGLEADPVMVKALGIHLDFARRRLTRGQVLSQPVQEFRAHYPELFGEVKHALEIVRPFPCESIPDEEVVPIAVYFAGS